jgi:hypothetical protein
MGLIPWHPITEKVKRMGKSMHGILLTTAIEIADE